MSEHRPYKGNRDVVTCQVRFGRDLCDEPTEFLHTGKQKTNWIRVYVCDRGHRFGLIDNRMRIDGAPQPPLGRENAGSGESDGSGESADVSGESGVMSPAQAGPAWGYVTDLVVVDVPSAKPVFGEP